MRTTAAFILLALAATLHAAPVMYLDGVIREGWPTSITTPDGWPQDFPPISAIEAAGYRLATQQEVEAQAEAVAAAQAEAEAQASLPQTFPTGIAVTNALGHWVEFVPDGTNVVAQTLAVQISQSPLTPEQRNQMRAAALATESNAKAAWLAAMAALKASIATNVNDAQAVLALTNNFTAAQCKTAVNDLRKELIDAAKDIKELRKQLAKYGRLDDE